MLRYCLQLVEPLFASCLRLVAHAVPGLYTGEHRFEAVLLEPLQVRLRQERQAALRDKIYAVGLDRLFERIHVIVELNPEARVVPADGGAFELRQEEPEVVPYYVEPEGLVRLLGVYTEAARIGAAHAADHGYYLDPGGLVERLGYEFPSLPHAGERSGLFQGGHMHALFLVMRKVLENVPANI